MGFVRKMRIALLTRKLRALTHDIAWARRDVRRHINTLRKEIRRTEQRLFALVHAQRNQEK